jgi:hypothetical protein
VASASGTVSSDDIWVMSRAVTLLERPGWSLRSVFGLTLADVGPAAYDAIPPCPCESVSIRCARGNRAVDPLQAREGPLEGMTHTPRRSCISGMRCEATTV